MNRLFNENLLKYRGDDYEYLRAKEIAQLMINEQYDYVFDLHSTSSPSVPFCFCEHDGIKTIQELGIPYILTWWSKLGEDMISGDTESFVNSIGGKWFTFESWSHLDPDGYDNCYEFIIKVLNKLWMIETSTENHYLQAQTKLINIIDVYIAQSDYFKYIVNTEESFEVIKKWMIIWFDNEQAIIAQNDFIMIMPKKQEIIKKWNEVFFYGQVI